MSDWIQDTLPGLGIAFATKRARVFNRTGGLLPAGSVMQFDLKRTSPFSTNSKPGDPNSVWSNGVACEFVTTGGKGGQTFTPTMILLEPIEPDKRGLVALWGVIDAQLDGAGAVSYGLPIAVNANGTTVLRCGTLDSSSKVIGWNLELRAGAGLCRILFNGWHGWGKV